jgi:hypothetical protein
MKRVGILGAYGAVGRCLVRLLRERCRDTLRVGGRNRERVLALLRDELGPGDEARMVDIEDGAGLAAFCAGCDLVIHCGGPSYVILDKPGRAAAAAGAHYIDVGGDEPAYERLADLPFLERGLMAILSAGLMPGLSGLLPRWLAQSGFDRVRDATAYFCIRDNFSPSSARDFLLSLRDGYGAFASVWQDGVRITRSAQPQRESELAYFPRPVMIFPFLSREAERVARELQLRQLCCYSVLEPGQMPALLAQLRTGYTADMNAASDALCRAAEFDLLGCEPHQLFVYRMEGEMRGETVTQTAIFRGYKTAAVTAAVAYTAAAAILQDKVPPGLHFAAQVLEAEPTIAALRSFPGVRSIQRIEQGLEVSAGIEEGLV